MGETISVNCENLYANGSDVAVAGNGFRKEYVYPGVDDLSALTAISNMDNAHLLISDVVRGDDGVKGALASKGRILMQYSDEIKIIDNKASEQISQ